MMMIQLEKAVTDLSEILITQWIVWIQLFDFKVKHVFRSRHTAADELLKWLKVERKMNDIEDINEFIDVELNIVRIFILKTEKKINILKSEYSCKNQQIVYFLSIMKKLKNISASDYFKFCKKAMRFLVQKSHLFCY